MTDVATGTEAQKIVHSWNCGCPHKPRCAPHTSYYSDDTHTICAAHAHVEETPPPRVETTAIAAPLFVKDEDEDEDEDELELWYSSLDQLEGSDSISGEEELYPRLMELEDNEERLTPELRLELNELREISKTVAGDSRYMTLASYNYVRPDGLDEYWSMHMDEEHYCDCEHCGYDAVAAQSNWVYEQRHWGTKVTIGGYEYCVVDA